jgi:hypothetical protein
MLLLGKFPMDKLNIIVEYSNENRKILHGYLEKFTENKTSARSQLFESASKTYKVKSPCGSIHKLKKENFFRDPDDSRYDHYSWDCKICGEIFTYEPCYDSCMEIKTKTNNIIILGDYLRGYTRPKHAKRIENLDNISGEFESLIFNAQIYI